MKRIIPLLAILFLTNVACSKNGNSNNPDQAEEQKPKPEAPKTDIPTQ